MNSSWGSHACVEEIHWFFLVTHESSPLSAGSLSFYCVCLSCRNRSYWQYSQSDSYCCSEHSPLVTVHEQTYSFVCPFVSDWQIGGNRNEKLPFTLSVVVDFRETSSARHPSHIFLWRTTTLFTQWRRSTQGGHPQILLLQQCPSVRWNLLLWTSVHLNSILRRWSLPSNQVNTREKQEGLE